MSDRKRIIVKMKKFDKCQQITVSDNPNSVQSSPNFAKPPGRCMQTDKSAVGKYRRPQIKI